MSFDLFKYLTTLAFFYIYGRLFLHYGVFLWGYMLDEKMSWKLKLEKPRILFLCIGLGLMHLMSFARTTISPENYMVQVIVLLVFGLGFYFTIITWTDQFRKNIESRKTLPALKKERNFNLAISEDQIQKLYHGLMKYDLVNSEMTSLDDFKNVLAKNWDVHSSKIQFNMDGASCREFYDYFIQTFPENSLTMKNFFETSKLVVRSDGKFYKYNTIKGAPLKTISSKENDTLRRIFHKLALKQESSKGFTSDKLF